MELFEATIDWLLNLIWNTPEALPAMVIILLAYGIFITFRLGFIQFRQFKHGVKVILGTYDDPDDEGDLNHFQALSTALSATVGIGNIAGVALAIHFGGPGALFWMWITAILGMAIKYSEVTLAQKYRVTNEDGSVSGGPMYYIEKGLGSNWKWLAIAFAVSAAICAFLTGNAVQANTLADIIHSDFEIPRALTGFISASLVGAVILGGIKRIGYITARLVPFMGVLYVAAGLIILMLHYDQVLPSLWVIFQNAFNPAAGILGAGSGAFIFTFSYGVQRRRLSDEAGQGSSPIAHSTAKTDQPVREGVVALLEPFIDTLIVCSITGLVIVTTGAWDMYHSTPINPASAGYTYQVETGDNLTFVDGAPVNGEMLRNSLPVDILYTNEEKTETFTGTVVETSTGPVFISEAGTEYERLHGGIVENGAPLTARAFEIGLSPLFPWGGFVVTLAVVLFAISTAISWSYYGDRSAQYLLGDRSIVWYRIAFVGMHFAGAILSLTTVWAFGDVMLGLMAFFNIIGLIALSGVVVKITKRYFENTEV